MLAEAVFGGWDAVRGRGLGGTSVQATKHDFVLTMLLLLLLSKQMGFRCTRVCDGQLLHNNRPLLLRGVNRHEWHDRWGE